MTYLGTPPSSELQQTGFWSTRWFTSRQMLIWYDLEDVDNKVIVWNFSSADAILVRRPDGTAVQSGQKPRCPGGEAWWTSEHEGQRSKQDAPGENEIIKLRIYHLVELFVFENLSSQLSEQLAPLCSWMVKVEADLKLHHVQRFAGRISYFFSMLLYNQLICSGLSWRGLQVLRCRSLDLSPATWTCGRQN